MRISDQKYEQLLFWPADMYQMLDDKALETERSMSSIVQLAFTHAHEEIARRNLAQLRPLVDAFGGEKVAQSLYFPGDMLDEMVAHAKRLDAPVSLRS